MCVCVCVFVWDGGWVCVCETDWVFLPTRAMRPSGPCTTPYSSSVQEGTRHQFAACFITYTDEVSEAALRTGRRRPGRTPTDEAFHADCSRRPIFAPFDEWRCVDTAVLKARTDARAHTHTHTRARRHATIAALGKYTYGHVH